MLARKLLVGAAVGLLIGGLVPGCGDDDSSSSPTSPTPVNPPTGENRAPEALGVIPVLDLNIGEPTLVNVAPYFWDPDGDQLTYGAMSSDPDAVTATVSGTTVTLNAMSPRPATITVTATDPGNLTATQMLRYSARPGIYPEVWSQNGFDGESYEYKVNCDTDLAGVLEKCFLWELTAVRVEAPGGRIFNLEKDFNVQSYSGEVTRRWVLYGPPGAGFPASGSYNFRYYIGNTLEYEQDFNYTLKTVGLPTNVVWRREGDDMVVEWTPPMDGEPGMWYKALLFPDGSEVISQVLDWGASSARLPDIPLLDGTTGTVNVSLFFDGGYAYSEYVPLVW